MIDDIFAQPNPNEFVSFAPYHLVKAEPYILLPEKHVETMANKLIETYADSLKNLSQAQLANPNFQQGIHEDLQSLFSDERVTHCFQGKKFFINNSPQKCIFVDRDNCINDDHAGYMYIYKDIKIFPNAYKALAKLQSLGYLIVMVTNQSGIDRGYFTEEQFIDCMQDFAKDAYMTAGLIFDAVIYTTSPNPEHPVRKPNIGAFHIATNYFQIDLSTSMMIGDAKVDQGFAQNLGIKFVSVLTGRERI